MVMEIDARFTTDPSRCGLCENRGSGCGVQMLKVACLLEHSRYVFNSSCSLLPCLFYAALPPVRLW